MIVELRRNNQVIIPKRIAYRLGLDVGDRLDLVAEDGVLKFTPVKDDGEGRSAGKARRDE